MSKLSVVIPVYYNEGSLPLLIRELVAVEQRLKERLIDLELIFVDDGSGDNSLQRLLEIKQARPATVVVKLTRNFGAVHASKTGLGFVTGDCFTILAADLQDPPELILEMVEKWQSGAKVVLCERSERKDPFMSRIFSYLYYRLLRLSVASDYPPGGFDMALMDKSVLPHLLKSSKSMYTPLLIHWLGYPHVTILYERRPRTHGSSRWTFWKKVRSCLDALLGFSTVPIRLISAIGLIVSTISMAYALWIVIAALMGKMEVPGFATVVTLLAFLQGIGLFVMGILGEYVWRIFEDVNKRPETVIDEVF